MDINQETLDMDIIPIMENINENDKDTISLFLSLLRNSFDNYKDTNENYLKNVKWDSINDLIKHHKIGSLLFTQPNNYIGKIPKDTESLIKDIKQKTIARKLLSLRILEKIKTCFDDNEVPFLLIKGISIDNWIYTDYGMRHYGDIDILIDKHDFQKIMKLMHDLGFKLMDGGQNLHIGKSSEQYIRYAKDITFIDETSNLCIEMHWRLSSKNNVFPLAFEDAWKQKKTVAISNKKYYCLAENTHIAYLCYHGSKHKWESLFWLFDIAILIKKESTDWLSVLNEAKVLKSEYSVILACILASLIFKIPVPKIIYKNQDLYNKSEDLAQLIIKDIIVINPIRNSETLLSHIKLIYWQRNLNSSKLAFLKEYYYFITSPTMNDIKIIRLPNQLSILYRIIRPMRLIIKAFNK